MSGARAWLVAASVAAGLAGGCRDGVSSPSGMGVPLGQEFTLAVGQVASVEGASLRLALRAVREAGAELRPTLLPYTPWTRLEDLPALFEFALEHDLLEAIDPVQYTLRLLLPPGSLLLEGAGRWLRDFDAEAFSWRWEHEDRRVDALCRDSVAAVQAGAGFDELRALADRAAGRPGKSRAARSGRSVPRLTEPWSC